LCKSRGGTINGNNYSEIQGAVVAQFERGNAMQIVLEFIAGILAFFVMWAFLFVLLSF
jgi:hypothetical protein